MIWSLRTVSPQYHIRLSDHELKGCLRSKSLSWEGHPVWHLPSCTSGMRLKVPTHSNAVRPHRAYVPAVTGLSTLWIMLMLPLIETGYCTYVCKSLTEPTPTSVLLKENVRIPLIVMWTQRRTRSPLTICSPSLEWNKYFQHFSNDCVKQVCVTQTVSA